MKRFLVLAFAIVILLPQSADARTRTGAVTIRGVIDRVSSSGFSMRTTAHGTLQIAVKPQTQVTEKGASGRVRVAVGDHVGVRGFLSGTHMVAMTVRVYPIKPKPYSVRGTVSASGTSTISIATTHGTITGRVTSATTANVGSGASLVHALHRGERVEARLVGNGTPVILHIHVYLGHTAARHLSVSGMVVATSATSITVSTGTSRVTVTVTNSTTVRLGDSPASRSAIHIGSHVTVSACCVGQPLTATGIRVRRPKPAPSEVVRGIVRQAGSGKVVIAVGTQLLTCTISRATRITRGSSPVSSTALAVGARVSVRGRVQGSSCAASTIHIYASLVRMKTVTGVVVAGGHGSVTVRTAAGQRWLIQAAPGCTVVRAGQRSSIASAHVGDRVHARGRLGNGQALLAQSITITPVPVKTVTVRGTLVRAASGTIDILRSNGQTIRVRLGSGVRPTLQGAPAPPAALFPGAKIVVRGTRTGSTLTASSVSVQATPREETGRILAVSRTSMRLARTAATQIAVDLPAGVRVLDGGKTISATGLHVSAWVRVVGYEITATHLRATSISVQHPGLTTSATVVATQPALTVQTSAGSTYRVRTRSGTAVTVSRYALPVRVTDLPIGCHVRVDGVVQSDGSILASTISATIRTSVTRGTVSVISPALSVRTAAGAVTVRPVSDLAVTQGSRASTISEIVVGDDLTLHGYLLAGNVMLVRAIDLHRRLAAFDGTVAAITTNGFTLTTATSTIQVIVQVTTQISGYATAISAGAAVHVTGYVRGDGVIEATRVKIGKSRKPSAPAGHSISHGALPPRRALVGMT